MPASYGLVKNQTKSHRTSLKKLCDALKTPYNYRKTTILIATVSHKIFETNSSFHVK